MGGRQGVWCVLGWLQLEVTSGVALRLRIFSPKLLFYLSSGWTFEASQIIFPQLPGWVSPSHDPLLDTTIGHLGYGCLYSTIDIRIMAHQISFAAHEDLITIIFLPVWVNISRLL